METNDRAAARADKKSSDGDLASASADLVASGRDQAAADRELISTARDNAATARDRAAEALERAAGPGGPEYKAAVKFAAKVRANAAADREQAATDRKQAASDRAEAEIDRGRASRDRQHASIDREHAAVDRRQALDELELAHTDGLTGAYRRGAGQAVLQQEVNRSERTGESLVLAFVDLDGLKRTNDIQGHAAGDARLRDVFDAMRSKLRIYEPIVRHGGDEFLCSVAGVAMPDVEERFDEIEVMLNSGENSRSVSVGLAELEAGDSLKDLINRADEAMIRRRSTKSGPQSR
ncbi:MAG: GGDEF domain-containing protein [Solirubrobacterales bacterium]